MEILFRVRSKASGTVEEFKVDEGGTAVLGRGAESAVFLEGTELSREHVRIQVKGEAVLVTDLSSNGTWVDGQRLTRDRTVKIGGTNKIEFPGYAVEIVMPNVPAPPKESTRTGMKTVADMLPADAGASQTQVIEKPPLPEELKPLLDPPRGLEEMVGGIIAPLGKLLESVKSEERTILVLIGLLVGLWMVYNAAA
ncbi:MAG: FHA domain-containing protein [Bryobacteraceae bacterium]|nr:FHA domain-containing protein [Bryobacteraceae bacterium]